MKTIIKVLSVVLVVSIILNIKLFIDFNKSKERFEGTSLTQIIWMSHDIPTLLQEFLLGERISEDTLITVANRLEALDTLIMFNNNIILPTEKFYVIAGNLKHFYDNNSIDENELKYIQLLTDAFNDILGFSYTTYDEFNKNFKEFNDYWWHTEPYPSSLLKAD